MVNFGKIKTFYIVFLAVCAAIFAAYSVCAALGTFGSDKLATTVTDDNVYKISAENGYRQAIYTLSDSLKNMDADLCKTALSKDETIQFDRLMKIVSHANSVTANIAKLPVTAGDALMKLEKFANQTGDYSAYLMKKLMRGEQLSEQDKSALLGLRGVCKILLSAVDSISGEGQFVTSNLFSDGSGIVDSALGGVSDAFEYEKLIYDGPFSDSVQQKTIKCAKTISGEYGKTIAGDLLGGGTVEYCGTQTGGGEFYCYTAKGDYGTARLLLTTDGRLVEMERFSEQTAVGGEVDVIAVAENFCRKLGYDVSAVWVSRTSVPTTYVNLAPTHDGVIYYPDLVKVEVDSSSGLVLGVEARAYLLNHRQRNVTFGSVTEKQAADSLDASLRIISANKALINKDGEEFCCYEFECESGSDQYFVYIDSVSGAEKEIFKVISGTEGNVVM